LYSLYTTLSDITLSTTDDHILWRWNTFGQFTTNSYYTWLEFGGVRDPSFQKIWKSTYTPENKNILMVSAKK
jgi:hypothetical protein